MHLTKIILSHPNTTTLTEESRLLLMYKSYQLRISYYPCPCKYFFHRCKNDPNNFPKGRFYFKV